jgi:uncharacterized protein YkwD
MAKKIELKEVKKVVTKVADGKKLTAKDIDILEEVNKYRVTNKMRPLMSNPKLQQAATDRAKSIYENNDFTHGPVNGAKYKAFVKNLGDYDFIAENLARKFKTKRKMVEAWQKSPLHKANLLNAYDETGIGTYGDVTVQYFARKTKKNGNSQ